MTLFSSVKRSLGSFSINGMQTTLSDSMSWFGRKIAALYPKKNRNGLSPALEREGYTPFSKWFSNVKSPFDWKWKFSWSGDKSRNSEHLNSRHSQGDVTLMVRPSVRRKVEGDATHHSSLNSDVSESEGDSFVEERGLRMIDQARSRSHESDERGWSEESFVTAHGSFTHIHEGDEEGETVSSPISSQEVHKDSKMRQVAVSVLEQGDSTQTISASNSKPSVDREVSLSTDRIKTNHTIKTIKDFFADKKYFPKLSDLVVTFSKSAHNREEEKTLNLRVEINLPSKESDEGHDERAHLLPYYQKIFQISDATKARGDLDNRSKIIFSFSLHHKDREKSSLRPLSYFLSQYDLNTLFTDNPQWQINIKNGNTEIAKNLKGKARKMGLPKAEGLSARGATNQAHRINFVADAFDLLSQVINNDNFALDVEVE